MTRTAIAALTLTAAAAVVGLSGWSSRPGAAEPAAGDQAPGGTIHLPVVCDTPLKPPRVAPDMPADVEGALMQKNFNVVQRAVDIFALSSLNCFAHATASAPEPERSTGQFNQNKGLRSRHKF